MTSQYRQDEFVVAMLGPHPPGFFLDSGASDGVRASNTELLEKQYGWTGICVEPNPEFFQNLTQNRRCVAVNCCLYDFDGTVPFVRAGTVGGVPDQLATAMLPHIRKVLRLSDGEPLPTETVASRTVGSVLEQYRAPTVIDYWSLDTEGSELTVLRRFPFGDYLVRMLTVEHNWGVDRAAIRDLLLLHGLLRVAELGCDDVYVHRSVINRRGAWRSRALRPRIPSSFG